MSGGLDPVIDRAALQAWFEERFGSADLFDTLISDIVMDEATHAIDRGEALDWDAFPARCSERIETTLLALVHAEARGRSS